VGTPNLEVQFPKLITALAPLLGAVFETTRTFTVAGERYVLKPDKVLSVFPPADSSGDLPENPSP
jgi:hypothetical protein